VFCHAAFLLYSIYQQALFPWELVRVCMYLCMYACEELFSVPELLSLT